MSTVEFLLFHFVWFFLLPIFVVICFVAFAALMAWTMVNNPMLFETLMGGLLVVCFIGINDE